MSPLPVILFLTPLRPDGLLDDLKQQLADKYELLYFPEPDKEGPTEEQWARAVSLLTFQFPKSLYVFIAGHERGDEGLIVDFDPDATGRRSSRLGT